MEKNNKENVSYHPKRKRNVFFGMVLIIFSFDLLLKSIHGALAK